MPEQEQTAVLDQEQTGEPGIDQTIEAGAQTDVAGSGENGAEFDYGQIDETWVRNALERSDVLKRVVKEREDSGFNAGKQRAAKDARLEQGSADQAQRYHEWVVNQIDAGADPKELAKQTPLWVKANRDTERVTTAKTYAEKVLDIFDVTERDNITQAFDLIVDDPDQSEQLADAVLAEALTRKSKNQIANLSLTDIPEGSSLWKALDEWKSAELAKELEARQMESKTQTPNAPRPQTSGAPAGSNIDRFLAMSEREQKQFIDALPMEEFEKLKNDLLAVTG